MMRKTALHNQALQRLASVEQQSAVAASANAPLPEPRDIMSPLARAILNRGRKLHVYGVERFFNLRGEQIPKLGVLAPLKTEQDKAIDQAYATLAKQVSSEGGRNDVDVVRDWKTIHILHKACVDPTPKQTAPGQPVYYDAAFPSPQWMADNLKTDEIAILLNLVNGACEEENQTPGVDDTTVERFVEAVQTANAMGVGLMDHVTELLAECGREWCINLFVQTAIKLSDARAELDALTGDAVKDNPPDAQVS